jgi:hypoxanthine phosphoribosyltransferase
MKTLLTAEQLSEGVDRLAQEMAEFYQGRPVTILGVLTGSIVLVSDLIRRVDLPLRIGFVHASSYRGPATSPQDLVVKFDSMPDLQGRHVLIVDDIFDTGYTMTALFDELSKHRPATLRSMVLLRKHGRKAVSMEPDHVGFEIPNEFVVGYGLDYHDNFRHLPHLAALDPHELSHQE